MLDAQLQDTIYQFEHREGGVGRINREEGDGTKSQKLADALLKGQPIIIVIIRTFPFVLEEIQENTGVMDQVRNNTPEQAMLGDFPKAVEEAVLASGDAHQELMAQFLANKSVQTGFARLLLEMLAKPA